MPIRVLIVDDEPLARERIRTLLAEEQDVEIVGECVNGTEALAAIAEKLPDGVFLDVQMPGLTGFDVLRSLPEGVAPVIIFTTAHDEFALQAFEVNASDYLLKPFKQARFRQALDRLRREAASPSAAGTNRQLTNWLDQRAPLAPGLRRLMVRTGDRVVILRLEEIDWIEAAGNYAILHVGKTNHLLRETMTRLEEQLPSELFFRASRSAFIHISRVRELQPLPGGQHVILLQDGQKVTMTRPLRDLQEHLGLNA